MGDMRAFQVIGATTSGSSLGTSIPADSTSYAAWTLLGTSGAPINYVCINATYPVGGTDNFVDIGIGPSGSQAAASQAKKDILSATSVSAIQSITLANP